MGDVLDEAAPEAPELLSAEMIAHDGHSACGGDSCGNFATLGVSVTPPHDDDTDSENLVYAIYAGRSPEAVRSAVRPVHFAQLRQGSALVFVDFRWSERDVYAAVTALDPAGNESEPSQVLRVYNAPGPCSTGGAARGGSQLGWIAAALLALAARRRRTAARSKP